MPGDPGMWPSFGDPRDPRSSLGTIGAHWGPLGPFGPYWGLWGCDGGSYQPYDSERVGELIIVGYLEACGT